jgi:hypothetical protein
MGSDSPVVVSVDLAGQDTTAAARPQSVPAPPPPAPSASAATAEAVAPSGGGRHTMLSAFAPAVNQATAASAEGGTGAGSATREDAGADSDAGAAPTLGGEGHDMLLWHATSPSGNVPAGSPMTVQSLERVEEDVAALWWS